MSPNGRRRWRKHAKHRRKRMHGVVVLGKILRSSDCRGRRGDKTGPGPLPTKPWTPRSLVGMTMGARKRAALWAVFVPHCLDWLGYDPSTSESPQAERRHMTGCLKHSRTLTALYRDERAKYRIGEKLRPCPNCLKCWPLTKTLDDGRIAALAPSGTPKRYQSLTLDDLCDGSGLLPARRSTNAA